MSIGYSTIVAVFAIAFLLNHMALLNDGAKGWLLSVLYGGFAAFGVRLCTLVYLLWVGRRDWRRKPIDQIIARDEAHALPLTTCPEQLLIYAKDWMKRQLDRRERNSATLMKDLGVIPAIALLYAAFNAWQSFHIALPKLHVDGMHVEALAPMIDTLFWSGLLAMVAGLLANRLQAMRYAYRIEIIDIALSIEFRSRGGRGNDACRWPDPRALTLRYRCPTGLCWHRSLGQPSYPSHKPACDRSGRR